MNRAEGAAPQVIGGNSAGELLAIRRQEVADPFDGVLEIARPGECDDAEVVLIVEVESAALHDQDPVSYTHLTLPTNREV